MTEKPGVKKTAGKGQAKVVKKKGRSLSSLYTINGEKAERKNKFCPKCGLGFFLSLHKNRTSCGKCGYTEFRKN